MAPPKFIVELLKELKSSYRTRLVGKTGELIASLYLSSNNYLIISKNFKGRSGELDIVAYKNYYLVIVEVKTRSSKSQFFNILNSIDDKKVKALNRTKYDYIKKKHRLLKTFRIKEIRFDVITISFNKLIPEISHYANFP